MLLRHTLLYMPAQLIGPLFQLIAMIVWTHVVNEHTLGVITLVTATHELLQIGFLAWWSQYALRFFGRFQTGEEAQRFYRTENAILLLSVFIQSVAIIGILFLVIAPDAKAGLLTATVAYVLTRSLNLYIGERARVQQKIGVYSVQQIIGPALGFLIGLLMIDLFGQNPEWPLAGYAIAQLAAVLIVLPKIGFGRNLWPVDRTIVNHALHYGIPIIVGSGLGWVGLNASRFIVNDILGVAAAGLFAVGYGLGQRAAAVAAMLVTAAAFPIAVKRMESSGSNAAMQQLSENSALLVAILAPSIVGIFMLRTEIVHLLIAMPFQQVTLAVLPLSVLAGAIRNLRAHFGDQVFLLHSRTRLMIVVASIDAVVTVALSFAFIWYWGIIGGAVATVIAAAAAAITSFAIGFSQFNLTLPLGHLFRIAIATAAMGAALRLMPEAANFISLAAHVASGAAIYSVVLVLLYAPLMFRMLRARPQRSQA
ncbi:MAG: polysaccharide biosynthesis C-terminal domain-containing protein [Afipia sp.]|jgi:O-antigen/teichoic acid export membrane protein|nr:polysaccharide biosynthesis C-terminal domain-containing protein [Afipia sp.]MBS4006632.1 polysaccharide biosynthesis C-terminal domain-containing protein [Afipia sp.]WIG52004.1 MAG: Polysaccharide biosynthesis protein [Afipia sp.]